jgi:DNA ligase-1
MKKFAALYRALDETTKTTRKLAALTRYFSECDAADGAWAVYFLTGRRLKRLIPTALMRQWCAEAAGVSDWMFDECYGATGDLAEAMSLLLPEGAQESQGSLADWVERRIRPLAEMSDDARRAALLEAWSDLSSHERFVFNKLVTGSFRVGVSQQLVTRALAEVAGLAPAVIAHRLMGQPEPTPVWFQNLLLPEPRDTDISRPYPFCLAHPLQAEPTTLGDARDWIIEWKWDGIRGQIIRRGGQSFLWSRGEEMILERFPELIEPISQLPDGTVLDGEILAWRDGQVLPFGELQRRIGRKNVGRKLLMEVPVRFVAFDALETAGKDIRGEPFSIRRRHLENILADRAENDPLMRSPFIRVSTWEELAEHRATSRVQNVEGVMLKRADSPYAAGRVTGLWWKWKIEPYTCDAVLVYAQRGHGRRASLYTDYTFAAWDNGELVPFAKAYSGLTDNEIRDVDRFVRKNTLDKFGPVRSVRPELVFELAFENIQRSTRHKSGIAVRFPRIARWRHDKRPQDANTLAEVRALLPTEVSK